MPKVSPEHLQQRRQQVIQAAVHCFANKGFHACTMQDICNQAGLSPGAVYRYFPSKESIIENMVEQESVQNQQLFQEMNKQGDVRRILEGLIDVFFDQFEQEDSRICSKLGMMLQSESINNSRIKKLLQKNIQQILGELLNVVEAGKKSGALDKNLNSKSFVQALFALHRGLVSQIAQDEVINVQSYKEIMKRFVRSTYSLMLITLVFTQNLYL